MPYTFILTETHDKAGLIRLNRPKELNALNHIVMEEIAHALQTFDADPKIGAMVITGNERRLAVTSAGQYQKRISTKGCVPFAHIPEEEPPQE